MMLPAEVLVLFECKRDFSRRCWGLSMSFRRLPEGRKLLESPCSFRYQCEGLYAAAHVVA